MAIFGVKWGGTTNFVTNLVLSHLAIPRSRLLVLAEPGGCAGGFTQSTPLLLFSRWLQVFILTWVVHVYSCPGLALFCLPIDTAPTWHLLPLPVASPLWFRSLVGLFGPGSAGWDTVGRMGWFLPSSPRSDRSDTHTPDPPSLTVRLVRAFLRFWHLLPRFGSRDLIVCFLPRSPGFVPGPRFRLAPSGHARDPEFRALRFGLWADFGVVCGGMVGLVRSPVWWGRMQPLQLCLPPS